MPDQLRLSLAFVVVIVAAAMPARAADPPRAAGTALCAPIGMAASPLPTFSRLATLDDRALAMFALPFARMAMNVRELADNDVRADGYQRGPNSPELFQAFDPPARLAAGLAGFFGGTFVHCASGTIVAVYRSTSPYDPRDWFAGIARYTGGGYSDLALRFFDAVAARFPGHPIVVVGHSSGGGLASYVAGQRSAPSVVFNGTRSDAAVTNPGGAQLAIIIAGDPIADPVEASARRDGAPQPALNGTVLRLTPVEDYNGWVRHWIATVISELERLIE
ncbi:MAG: hypothetical protein AB7O56_14075 [Bauldia sp.]